VTGSGICRLTKNEYIFVFHWLQKIIDIAAQCCEVFAFSYECDLSVRTSWLVRGWIFNDKSLPHIRVLKSAVLYYIVRAIYISSPTVVV